MRIAPSTPPNELRPSLSIVALSVVALAASIAFAPTSLSAQTSHRSATHTAQHVTSATHAATSGGCITPPELSPKIPAVPAGSPCAKALYTITTQPDVRLDYVNPVEGDLAKTLGLESTSFTLGYIDTRVGAGALAQPDKWYTVKYTGYLADGTVFDSSDKHAETVDGISFHVGAHQVVAGWDTGFAGMRVGGKRRLFIPFQLAYGPSGRPPTIPARAELIFDMELVSQSDTQPAPKTPPAAANDEKNSDPITSKPDRVDPIQSPSSTRQIPQGKGAAPSAPASTQPATPPPTESK